MQTMRCAEDDVIDIDSHFMQQSIVIVLAKAESLDARVIITEGGDYHNFQL